MVPVVVRRDSVIAVADELVFSVVHAVEAISLADAGLREREHLQEWVLAHPEVLGPGILIVTSEFDRWESRAGAERDRLDILGLSSDGHLVVAELKRGLAPDTVDMQAIKYAAMASRFDIETLTDAYVEFVRKHSEVALTSEEAAEQLQAHTEFTLSDETLRAPRIVLVAGGFPANVTATAVWLSEMGLDIALTRVQAYRTPGEVIVTVSRHYPPPDVEEFLVAPTRAARRARPVDAMLGADWTEDDLRRLRDEVSNVTVRATLDLCSAQPNEWVPSDAVQAATGRPSAKHRGDYGGFGVTLRARFKRSNAPFEMKWAALGTSQQYYKLSPQLADWWVTLTGEPLDGAVESE